MPVNLEQYRGALDAPSWLALQALGEWACGEHSALPKLGGHAQRLVNAAVVCGGFLMVKKPLLPFFQHLMAWIKTDASYASKPEGLTTDLETIITAYRADLVRIDEVNRVAEACKPIERLPIMAKMCREWLQAKEDEAGALLGPSTIEDEAMAMMTSMGPLPAISGPAQQKEAGIAAPTPEQTHDSARNQNEGVLPTMSTAGNGVPSGIPDAQTQEQAPASTLNVIATDEAFNLHLERAKRIHKRYPVKEIEAGLREFQAVAGGRSILEDLGNRIAEIDGEIRQLGGAVSDREGAVEVEFNGATVGEKYTVEVRKGKLTEAKRTDTILVGLRAQVEDKKTERDMANSAFYAKRKELDSLVALSELVCTQLLVLGGL